MESETTSIEPPVDGALEQGGDQEPPPAPSPLLSREYLAYTLGVQLGGLGFTALVPLLGFLFCNWFLEEPFWVTVVAVFLYLAAVMVFLVRMSWISAYYLKPRLLRALREDDRRIDPAEHWGFIDLLHPEIRMTSLDTAYAVGLLRITETVPGAPEAVLHIESDVVRYAIAASQVESVELMQPYSLHQVAATHIRYRVPGEVACRDLYIGDREAPNVFLQNRFQRRFFKRIAGALSPESLVAFAAKSAFDPLKDEEHAAKYFETLVEQLPTEFRCQSAFSNAVLTCTTAGVEFELRGKQQWAVAWADILRLHAVKQFGSVTAITLHTHDTQQQLSPSLCLKDVLPVLAAGVGAYQQELSEQDEISFEYPRVTLKLLRRTFWGMPLVGMAFGSLFCLQIGWGKILRVLRQVTYCTGDSISLAAALVLLAMLLPHAWLFIFIAVKAWSRLRVARKVESLKLTRSGIVVADAGTVPTSIAFDYFRAVEASGNGLLIETHDERCIKLLPIFGRFEFFRQELQRRLAAYGHTVPETILPFSWFWLIVRCVFYVLLIGGWFAYILRLLHQGGGEFPGWMPGA